MKYFFPIHLDGGNRGCEAIAKSSSILLDAEPENIVGYCRDVALDGRLGLGQYLTLVPCNRGSYVVDRMLAATNRLLHTSTTRRWRHLYPYKSLLKTITTGDVVLFTGGDMLCYDDNEVIYINDWLHQHGIKTVLWGCSMGPENQTKDKLKSLSNFSFIYARESLTYEYFKTLGLKDLCLLPDPAFILPAEDCPLPDVFGRADVVGLNVSNYVMGGVTMSGRFAQEVVQLVTYILEKTDLNILLVPHVTWNFGGVNQDDRQMAAVIRQHFGNPDRITILDMDSLNYCQIRHVISQCRLFIGARTHSVISAYSMCVPTIALGYSIKSRGIAHDIGLDESLIVDSKHFEEGDLLRSFQFLMQNEQSIRGHLQSVMPEYSQRPRQIQKHFKNIKNSNR